MPRRTRPHRTPRRWLPSERKARQDLGSRCLSRGCRWRTRRWPACRRNPGVGDATAGWWMASAYTRIAKSRMVSRSRPGGNGNGQRDGAADDLDGMDIGWLKPFATPRTGTLQKATDAAEAPTDRRHALVQKTWEKTWMPWRRPGCRGEAAAGDGLRKSSSLVSRHVSPCTLGLWQQPGRR